MRATDCVMRPVAPPAVHAAKSNAVVAELAIATVAVLSSVRMRSAPDRCDLRTVFRAGEHLTRARPFLPPQPVGDSAREEQTVQGALVFDQHAVRGAACDTNIHPELTRAVVIHCVDEGLRLRGSAAPDDRHVVLLIDLGWRSLMVGAPPFSSVSCEV